MQEPNNQITPEEDRALTRYLHHIVQDIHDVPNHHPNQLRLIKYMSRFNKTKILATPPAQYILFFQEQQQKELSERSNVIAKPIFLFEKAKLFTKNMMDKYLTSFRTGDDRKRSAIELKKDVDKCSNILEIIASINVEYSQSLVEDNKFNQKCSALYKRGAVSRYRTTLLHCKTWLFALCAPSTLNDVISTELINLNQNLALEINRDYYQDKPKLKSLVTELLDSAKADAIIIEKSLDENNQQNANQYQLLTGLAKNLSYLERIRKHPDYNAKQCCLKNVYDSLRNLYDRAKSLIEPEQQPYHNVYNSIKKLMSHVAIKDPSIYCFFSDSFYQIPINNRYTEMLNRIPNAKNKFYTHEIICKINHKLSSKFHAADINFNFAPNDINKLQIEFKLANDPKIHRLLIHLDIKNNTYIAEPLINIPQRVNILAPIAN